MADVGMDIYHGVTVPSDLIRSKDLDKISPEKMVGSFQHNSAQYTEKSGCEVSTKNIFFYSNMEAFSS